MLAQIVGLRRKFFRRFVGDVAGGPDLAVRVRVGAAHDRALVFKDLHVVDEIALAEVARLIRPSLNDGLHFGQRELR